MPDTNNTESKGWVYLIVNDLIPDRVKIGYTMRDPIDRAYELISTGTTGTFVVIYQALVCNPYRVEQAVHRRLADLNCGLEWFRVCPNHAKEEIRSVAGSVLYEDTTPRWHRSQPEPALQTKELLAEAKKAAEELRLSRERADIAARLAAEQERIRAAEAAVREREAREAEEQRQRAEQEAIVAAQEELRRQQERRRREQAAQAQAELERLNESRKQAAAQFLRGIILAILPCSAIYIACRPFSLQQVRTLQAEADASAARVTSLRNKTEVAKQAILQAQQEIASLEQEVPVLRERVRELTQNEKKAVAALRFAIETQRDSFERYAPDGIPTGPRNGVSLGGIQNELAVRQKKVSESQSDLEEIRREKQACEERILSISKRQQTLQETLVTLDEALIKAGGELQVAQAVQRTTSERLGKMLDYNARFIFQKKK